MSGRSVRRTYETGSYGAVPSLEGDSERQAFRRVACTPARFSHRSVRHRCRTGLWAVAGGEWGRGDDADGLAAIEAAFDAGVNFFDTADVYGAGHSEELLGRSMAGRRDRFIVATKIGWTDFDRARDRSQYDTVEQLVAGVTGSLRRLGTDYVDVIQCHAGYPEPNTGSSSRDSGA